MRASSGRERGCGHSRRQE